MLAERPSFVFGLFDLFQDARISNPHMSLWHYFHFTVYVFPSMFYLIRRDHPKSPRTMDPRFQGVGCQIAGFGRGAGAAGLQTFLCSSTKSFFLLTLRSSLFTFPISHFLFCQGSAAWKGVIDGWTGGCMDACPKERTSLDFDTPQLYSTLHIGTRERLHSLHCKRKHHGSGLPSQA